MRKANAPRKLSPDVSRRLSDSRRQSAALTLREIHCPFCSFLVEKVFSDAAGHKMVSVSYTHLTLPTRMPV